MSAKRAWWIGLKIALIAACEYIIANQDKLPADLPQTVRDAFPYIIAACHALKEYDKVTKRGD